MRNLLRQPPQSTVWQRLFSLDTLFAFDFDGTLVPLAHDPEAADFSPEMADLFVEFSRARRTAIVTGRARHVLLKKLPAGSRDIEVVGNHGFEWSPPVSEAERFRARIPEWSQVLHARLDDASGIVVEDKDFGLSVHYRHAPHWEEAQKKIAEATQSLREARLIPGKAVVNVVPAAPFHKGTAIEALKRRYKPSSVAFFGDDVTDEDVFELKAPWLISIRIEKSNHSHADYFIPKQSDMFKLLQGILTANR